MGRPAAYLHVDGFDEYGALDFNKRKIRAAMRKAGQLVAGTAQLSVALSRGQEGYPGSRTGRLVDSIRFKVSRSGFMVKVAPIKSGDMADFYPAYLHYGVKAGARVRGRPGVKRRARGGRAALLEQRQAGAWRISPRENYIQDALSDRASRVKAILSAAMAAALT